MENVTMRRSNIVRKILLAVAALLCVYLLGVLVLYAAYDGYLDHGEPIVAAAAFKMLSGAQVYPAFDSGNFTSNVYGPALYLTNGLMFALFGGSIVTSKMSGLIAAFGTVAVMGLAFRRIGLLTTAGVMIAIVGFILSYVPISIWNRPDPQMMLLCALGVLVVRSDNCAERPVLSAVGLGLLGGFACSLKIYGPVCLAPMAVYFAMRHGGFKSLCIMSVVGLAAVALPFAFSVFELSTYVQWIKLIAGKPTAEGSGTKAIRYGVFFLLPPIILALQRSVQLRSFPAALRDPLFVYAMITLLVALICVYLGAKPGAGIYYLLPLAPSAIDMMVRVCTVETIQAGIGRVALLLFCISIGVILTLSVPVQKRYVRALDWDHARAISEDLSAINAAYPGKSIEMGIGDNVARYQNTFQRTELIFSGHPYTIDFGIMIETSKLGIPMAPKLLARFEQCSTDIWLVPKDEKPFAMRGYYGNQVTPPEFQALFQRHYHKDTQSFRFFDVWQCSH